MLKGWFNDGKGPPQVVLEKIVGYMHRIAKPVHLGFIARDIGYSIEQTHLMLSMLEASGVVRPLRDEEKRSHFININDDVWMLVSTAHPNKARW